MSEPPIRLAVVDDHAVVRQALGVLLGMDKQFVLVGEAEDGDSAEALYRDVRPDIVLMDIRMPGSDGIEGLRRILAFDATAKVIMLTSYELDEDVCQAVAAGAAGYLLKSVDHAELFRSLLKVHKGEKCIPGPLAARARELVLLNPLSPRELEVLGLIATGSTNQEIGTLLEITERTAKAHVHSIFHKLSVSDRSEAVNEGYRRGILRVDG